MLNMNHPRTQSVWQPRPQRRAQSGISMIEALIVIVLFSFGLLGLVGLQARAVQTSIGAQDSNRAALLANDLVAQMWGQNTVNLPAATVTAWTTRLADPTAGGLPNGVGTVVVAGNVATVTVSWRPPHEDASRTYRYVTEVLIP
jgi:type IV pilus assembly protein PilV